MKTLARLVTRYPKTIVAIVVLATVFFGWAATKIERGIDLEENLPKSEPRIATYQEVQDKYSGGKTIVTVLTGDDIFGTGSLRAVDRITKGLLNLDGIKKVTSLTNVTEFRNDIDGLKSGSLVDRLPESPQESEALRKRIVSDPWYAGRLVSDDGRSTILVANLAKSDSLEEDYTILRQVRELVEREKRNLAANYAGPIVMTEEIERYLGKDLALLFPLVLLLIVAVLFLTFRSLRGVILTFVTVVISVIWTVGFMALLGRPISMVSNLIPILLIAVGAAYGIHIIARFQEGLAGGLDKMEAVKTAVGSAGFGVWMAAITTIAGFGSLALSKVRMIFDFGVFSAFGVAVAFIVSLTFIPAILTLLPSRRAGRDSAGRDSEETHSGQQAKAGTTTKITEGITEKLLARAAALVVRRYAAVLVTAMLVISLAFAGWPRLVTTFDPAESLPNDSDPRKAEALVDAKFGGSAELNIVVKGDLNNLEFLQAMERFQSEMEKLGARQPVSVVNLLTRINRAFNGGDPKYETLPGDPGAIPQYLFLLSVSATPEELAEFMSFDQNEARISARMSNVMNTTEKNRLIAELEKKAASVFGKDAPVKITGVPILSLAMTDIIRDEQIKNIASSVIAVLLLVIIAFRSLITGLLCIAPIVLTIITNFGLMGWLGIPLDTATATISSLATGIGIDYSIHFYRRYLEERERGRAADEAIVETARTTGVAIVANAVAVGAGFAILLLSEFKIFRNFGGLIALTMVFTSVGALTVLPAIEKLRIRFSRNGFL